MSFNNIPLELLSNIIESLDDITTTNLLICCKSFYNYYKNKNIGYLKHIYIPNTPHFQFDNIFVNELVYRHRNTLKSFTISYVSDPDHWFLRSYSPSHITFKNCYFKDKITSRNILENITSITIHGEKSNHFLPIDNCMFPNLQYYKYHYISDRGIPYTRSITYYVKSKVKKYITLV